MKKPTTPYSIEVQEKAQITKEFLISQGWEPSDELSLYDSFRHSKNNNLTCSIGLYGEFYLSRLDWLEKIPDRVFNTVNRDLTKEDYFKIIDLLKIKVPK